MASNGSCPHEAESVGPVLGLCRAHIFQIYSYPGNTRDQKERPEAQYGTS
jgi:hypothetical protein